MYVSSLTCSFGIERRIIKQENILDPSMSSTALFAFEQ